MKKPNSFLSDFIDDAKNYSETEDYKSLLQITRLLKKGVVFSLPEGGTLVGMEKIKSFPGKFLKPPYPIVVLAYYAEGFNSDVLERGQFRCSRRIVIALDREDGVELIALNYIDKDRVWMTFPIGIHLSYLKEDVFIAGTDQVVPEKIITVTGFIAREVIQYGKGMSLSDAEIANRFLADFQDEFYAYLQFCYVLQNNEVSFVDAEPSVAVNKMRKSAGKSPLFSYKTLTIGGPKQKSQHHGGTHASPRSHLRRGHYRTSKTGKRHWVQHHCVNGGTPGFVHKDYEVRGMVH